MFIRGFGPWGLIVLLPALVGAQQVTNEDLMSQIRSLQEDLTSRVKANETSIANLKRGVGDLSSELRQSIERQRQILDAISTEDSAGRRIPRLSAIMQQSEQFKQDVYNAVHSSLRREGTVRIANKTSSYQTIRVNGQTYGISAGQTLTLNKVPVGTVTTQLPGQRLENWTLSAPDYQEAIDIVPTSSPTATYYYSPSAYYVSQPEPVYYYYPVTYSYLDGWWYVFP